MSLPSPRLSWKVKIVYALGNFGFSILLSVVSFFLLFYYTDVIKVTPALASSALLIGKIWDIINDPLFGWISDRTRSRFGRRRVYLIFGALPLAITTFILWAMPTGLSAGLAFAWIALTYILFDTCFTLTQVPYWAMVPELTQDYDERTRLTAISGFGLLLGFFGGSIVMRAITSRFAQPSLGYLVAGAVIGAGVGLCLGLVAWRIKETNPDPPTVSEMPILKSLQSTLHNRPFNLLMAAFCLARLSFMLCTTFLAYYLTYQLKAGDKVTLALVINMVAVGLFIPFWKWVSHKKSKGLAYGLGLGIMAMALATSFFIPSGQVIFFFVILFIMGTGSSAHWVVPLAMVADVVEYDEILTGQRREGMYFGVYGLLDKIMRTIGVVSAGWVLQGFGYVAQAEQTSQALLGIRLFFGLVPGILLMLALPFLLFYPITRQRFADMRRQLKLNQEKSFS